MKALLALLLAVAIGVGLAATFVPDNAATVGGVAISQSTLNGDLSAIVNSTYGCFLQSADGVDTFAAAGASGNTTGKNGGYSTAFVDTWMENVIVNQLYANAVAHKHLPVPAAAATLARKTFKGQINKFVTTTEPGACGGTAGKILSSLPAGFRQRLYAAAADKLVLTLYAAGVKTTTAGLRAYYQTHLTSFTAVCVTVLEYLTQTASAATGAATTAVAQLKGGTTTISTLVAAIQKTAATEPTRKSGHTCKTVASTTLTTTVTKEVLEAAPGAVVGPITLASSSGQKAYLVSMVTSTPVAKFSASRTMEAIVAAYGAKVNKVIEAELKSTPVSVNPRYGSVSANEFLPPASPPVTSALKPTANVRTGGGSSLLTAAKG